MFNINIAKDIYQKLKLLFKIDSNEESSSDTKNQIVAIEKEEIVVNPDDKKAENTKTFVAKRPRTNFRTKSKKERKRQKKVEN